MKKYVFPSIPEIQAAEINVFDTIIKESQLSETEKFEISELTQEYKSLFIKLSKALRHRVLRLFYYFLDTHQFLQAKKLIKYAVYYLGNDAIKIVDEDVNIISYEAIRNGEKHIVLYNKVQNYFSCDCALSNGLTPYEGVPGICSHIECLWIIGIE